MKSAVPLKLLSGREHRRGLLLILFLGMVLCVWQLGSTGLVDETPPLFAAAGRAMSRTGDWITPRVNGLPRFDKPPLIYWLMGLLYALPGQTHWDQLGTWAARLPSALSTVLMMVALGDTAMKWPQEEDSFPRRTAIASALAFSLSPLVMIWSRIAVSDALLCSTLGLALLFMWRRFADPINESWWLAWFFLGLAILVKGPVALVLTLITLSLFGIYQKDLKYLFDRIRLIPGLIITLSACIPWYILELFVEGKPFWDSFFGYHNFQRFTTVVNSHGQPWWFFIMMFVVASLPFTPLLILGLYKSLIVPLRNNDSKKPEKSLIIFLGCWLLSVFLLFTSAATKLPSYWLPATPAAGLLIGFASIELTKNQQSKIYAWLGSSLLALILAISLWSSPSWLIYIKDHEMPNLAIEIIESKLAIKAAICFSLIAFLGTFLYLYKRRTSLLIIQTPLIALNIFVLLPMISLGDKLRQLPLRQAAQLIVNLKKPNEPLAMVGAAKPSLHFYTNEIVLYEGRSSGALVNLSERLNFDERQGWKGTPIGSNNSSSTVLIVIDQKTINRQYWKGLNYYELGNFGIYLVLRLDRLSLEKRAKEIVDSGIVSDWKLPRPERF